MAVKDGIKVRTATAVGVPTAYALPALETILKEFGDHPGSTSLALNVQQLHVPFEAMISVPIAARISAGQSRNEWDLQIHAFKRAPLYPTFEGTLKLQPVADFGSQIGLFGTYVVPLGALGRAIDFTILRGAAESTLNRFVCELANRVAALSRWAHLV